MEIAYGDTNKKIYIVVLLVLAVAFFFSNHYLFYCQLEDFDIPLDVVEGHMQEGTAERRFSFLLMGIAALLGFLLRPRDKLETEGMLGWALLFLFVWATISIAWSDDIVLTFRRLVVLLIFAVAGYSTVRLFPRNFIVLSTFFCTSLYLLIGIGAETVVGDISKVMSPEYRFAGTLHPNMQGINCVLMYLSSMALAGNSKSRRYKYFFWAMALTAIGGLILTKSRTSFGCLILAQAAVWIADPVQRKFPVILFGIIPSACLLYFLLGDHLIPLGTKYLLLGREADDVLTFTGRTVIWEKSLNYVAQNPILGYGFNTFWTTEHMREFTNAVGISIIGSHSFYLDLLLSFGIIGAIPFVFAVLSGGIRAWSRFRSSGDHTYGFFLAVIIFSAAHGLLESAMIDMSLQTFILICALIYLAMRQSEQVSPAET